MPLYQFELVDTNTVTKAGGAELVDDIQAMDIADLIARRVLNERPDVRNNHYAIIVSNEDGEEICRVPLDIIHERIQ